MLDLYLWIMMVISIPTIANGNVHVRETNNDNNSRYNDSIPFTSSTTTTTTTVFTAARAKVKMRAQSLCSSYRRDSTFAVRSISNIDRGGGSDEDMTTDRKDGDDQSSNIDSSSSSPFEIIKETVVYSGWRTITQRKVRMRNGHVVDFDLVGVKTGGSAVLIFAWDTKSRTCTLIREYMPGSNDIHWGLAAGLVEDKHNHNIEEAARQELEGTLRRFFRSGRSHGGVGDEVQLCSVRLCSVQFYYQLAA